MDTVESMNEAVMEAREACGCNKCLPQCDLALPRSCMAEWILRQWYPPVIDFNDDEDDLV
jgi:hypothetical protein